MMKKSLFILIILGTFYSYAQEKFVYSIEGLSPKYLVIKIDSLKSEKLYDKSEKWIKNYYKNPEEVIDTKSENEFIRITGVKTSGLYIGSVVYDIKYNIKISFKDEKYKFEPLSVSYRSQKFSNGWIEFDLNNGSMFFKKSDQPIKKFENFTIEIPGILNAINQELLTYLKSTEDEWQKPK